MSAYTDAVERGLEGLKYVSFGPIYSRIPCQNHNPDDCWECEGTGIILGSVCPECSGTGTGDCPDCNNGSVCVCSGCENYSEDIGDEGGFSWSQCGICGSSLGGNRYVWHWVDEDGEIMHEDDGCVDCLLYLSNGDEPGEWSE